MELATLYLLVDALRGGDGSAVRDLVAGAERALDADGIARVAGRLAGAPRLLVTGRGFSSATAHEAALKLVETSSICAHGYSGADLLHGPIALVEPGTPVIAIASRGAGGPALETVLPRLARRGAIVHRAGVDLDATAPLSVRADVPEELAPILEILPLQRLAHALARLRARDPDKPAGLQKVTATR